MEGEIIMENIKILTENLESLFAYSGGWILFFMGIICCIVGVIFALATCDENFLVISRNRY